MSLLPMVVFLLAESLARVTGQSLVAQLLRWVAARLPPPVRAGGVDRRDTAAGPGLRDDPPQIEVAMAPKPAAQPAGDENSSQARYCRRMMLADSTNPESTNPWIAALRESHDHLRALAGSLDSDQVRQRGYPAEWSIAQVLSHLGSGAEIGALTVRGGLAGTGAPDGSLYPAIWDRWNAKTPDAQAADALVADAELVALIEANAGSDAQFAVWSGPTDIAGVAADRLFEHAMHTWDVAVAVDRAAAVLPVAVPLLVDNIGRLVGFAAKPKDWTGVVHVTTVEPSRELALTIGAESSVRPWAGGEAEAELHLPAEALLRLVYGRLDLAHTPAVTAKGIELDQLRATFPGF